MSNRIAGIDYPRTIVQWAYMDGMDVGSVSPVFTMDDKYVVAVITAYHEEGIPPMEDLRDQLTPLVMNDLKGDVVVQKLKEAKTNTSSLAEIAGKMESKVDTVTNVNFNSRNIAGFGNESNLIAKIFTIETGTVSDVIKGNNAAFVAEVDKVIPPPAGEDHKIYEKQMLMNFQAKVNNNSYLTTLEEKSDIVDNRVKFF